MDSPVIKDSGERREFGTGAMRDMSEGKGRFDLLCPFAIAQLAEHMERGCKKYGDRNWEQGIPQSSFADSAERHLNRYAKGETDEDHLLAAFWNLHCAVSTRERIKAGYLPKSLNNFPPPRQQLTLFESQLECGEAVVHYPKVGGGDTTIRPGVITIIDEFAHHPSNEQLYHDRRACLALCDSLLGDYGECDGNLYACGDKGCADHLIALRDAS